MGVEEAVRNAKQLTSARTGKRDSDESEVACILDLDGIRRVSVGVQFERISREEMVKCGRDAIFGYQSVSKSWPFHSKPSS